VREAQESQRRKWRNELWLEQKKSYISMRVFTIEGR